MTSTCKVECFHIIVFIRHESFFLHRFAVAHNHHTTLSPASYAIMSLENLVKEPPEPLIAQPLFNDIRHAITEKTEAQDLIFEDIEPIAGFQIATSLYEDRETEQIHPRWRMYCPMQAQSLTFLSVHYNSVTKVLRIRVKSTAVLDCHNGWMHDELFRMYPAFLTKLEFRFLNTWTSTSQWSSGTTVSIILLI